MPVTEHSMDNVAAACVGRAQKIPRIRDRRRRCEPALVGFSKEQRKKMMQGVGGAAVV